MPARIHLLSLTGFTLILTIMVMQPVLPLYLSGRGLPPVEVGLVVGLMSLSLIVTELGAMVASRRLGRRGTVAMGSLGGALAQLWFTLGTGRPDWYLSRLLFGAFRGVLWPILFAEVAEAVPPQYHVRAFATFWLYFGGGLLLGPWVGGWIADAYGARTAMLTASGLALVPLLILRAITPRRDAGASVVSALMGLVRRRQIWPLWVLNAMHTTMYGLFGTFLPLLAADRGLGVAQIGLIFGISAAAFTLAQMPLGRMLERHSPVLILAPAFLARGLTIAAASVARSFAGFAGVSAAVGITGAAVPPTLSSRLAAAAPRDQSVAAMGGLNAAADAGFFLGPVIGGLVAAYNTTWPFLLAGAVGLIAVLWTRWSLGQSQAETHPAEKIHTKKTGGER